MSAVILLRLEGQREEHGIHSLVKYETQLTGEEPTIWGAN